MFGTLVLVLAGVSSAYSATFNVTVGADGQLAYSPAFVRAAPGDFVNFIFNPKNHTVTQSSFAQPCTPLDGGYDTGFVPVAAGTVDLPVMQLPISQADTPIWFHCKQPVGNHCGQGMVFAINPPTEGNNTFDAFQAQARATLNATATTSVTSVWSTPSPQPWATATATVTNGTSVWTTTYTSYLGSVPPSPAPQPIDHKIIVGVDTQFIYSPANISAAIGDTVTFEFHPKNHTVTQSSFSNPCQPLEQSTGTVGFKSGFQPVSADDTEFPTFRITINDTAPIWGYCGQTGHCAAGMVFAINAVESGPNNFANFVKLAKQTGATSTSTSLAPATTTGSSNNNSNAALSNAKISWIAIGFSIVAGLMF
ncbi:hypothetical protein P691DRAFT_733288 [Macrolepiota fuliginosa MF-IS2]|uniref:Cupredoxin n=1 Tax=Macrolepiota fuliginosa MF-IS2 TaxID=1400762 RepID=A0A9P5XB78_9AGAR|nr:hypothetical protein P691DRAFT_733288 [Macrolepiota fuliginosa MF-IS2]